MATSVGPDYAFVDGNALPDCARAAKHSTFVIMRAVFGRPTQAGSKSPVIDPIVARDADRWRQVGVPVGFYAFLCYPRKGRYTTPEPEDQMQTMVDRIAILPGLDLPPIFDVEEASDMLTPAQMFDWTLRAYRTLRDGYGVTPIMYTGAGPWVENLKNHAPGEMAECPLWLAKPWAQKINKPIQPAPTNGPLMDWYGTHVPWFGNWWLYQYQGDATGWPGFNKTVDASRFRVVGQGAKGPHVVWLQRRLGLVPDGDFGPKTKAKVIEVQRANNLDPDGFVGPRTWCVIAWNPIVEAP